MDRQNRRLDNLDTVILLMCLGIHLLQQKTKMPSMSHFELHWKVCAGMPPVQHVHYLGEGRVVIIIIINVIIISIIDITHFPSVL